jgi:hypothetical protein
MQRELADLSRCFQALYVTILAATSFSAPQLFGADQLAAPESQPQGLAANYAGDRGIAQDPQVVFADDFESWRDGDSQPRPSTWSVRRNPVSQTRVIPGQAEIAGHPGPGSHSLEIACWTTGNGSQTGGMSLKLGNYDRAHEGLGDGHDELFIRYYVKYDENYRNVQNHGGNLGGRDLKMPNAAWVGMAAIRDVSSRGYFYSGVQPYGRRDSREFEMGFYSYHLDKRNQWGENYEVTRRNPLKVGKWYCVERHMKLNSVDSTQADPAVADGVEQLWVDGELTIRKQGVRFRRVPHLKISFFTLETYYHGLPADYDQNNPIKVSFDNLVIARRYIGPMRSEKQ